MSVPLGHKNNLKLSNSTLKINPKNIYTEAHKFKKWSGIERNHHGRHLSVTSPGQNNFRSVFC